MNFENINSCFATCFNPSYKVFWLSDESKAKVLLQKSIEGLSKNQQDDEEDQNMDSPNEGSEPFIELPRK